MSEMNSPLSALKDASLLRTDGLIGGEWLTACEEQARFAVHDPATGQEIARVANLGAVDCAAALSAAEKA